MTAKSVALLISLIVVAFTLITTLMAQPLFSLFGNDDIFVKFRLEQGDVHFIKKEGYVVEGPNWWEVYGGSKKNYGYLYFKLPCPDKRKILKVTCEIGGDYRGVISLYGSVDGNNFVKLWERKTPIGVFYIDIPENYMYFYFYLEQPSFITYSYVRIYKDVYYVVGEWFSFDLTPDDPHFVSKSKEIKYMNNKWCIHGDDGILIFKVPEIKDCGCILKFYIYSEWGPHEVRLYSSEDGINYELRFKKITNVRDIWYRAEFKVIIPKDHKYFKFYLDSDEYLEWVGVWKDIHVFIVEPIPIVSVEVEEITGWAIVSFISTVGILLILSRYIY